MTHIKDDAHMLTPQGDRAAPLGEASSGTLAGLKRLTVGYNMSVSACPPSSAAHVVPGACCNSQAGVTDSTKVYIFHPQGSQYIKAGAPPMKPITCHGID